MTTLITILDIDKLNKEKITAFICCITLYIAEPQGLSLQKIGKIKICGRSPAWSWRLCYVQMFNSKSNLNALFRKSILTFTKFCNNFAIVVESFYHASFWIQSTKTTNNG